MSIRDKLIREYQASYTGLTFFRPDTSGIRGKGLNRKSYQKGDDEYPYGGPPPSYGQPAAYSRDSSGHGGTRQSVPVPKNKPSDDERWEDGIDEIGVEGWTSGTPVHGNIVQDPGRQAPRLPGVDDEDDLEEALGVPFNLAKSGQGTGGMHTGGRVQPGSSGEWSSGQWEIEIDDDTLDFFSDPDNDEMLDHGASGFSLSPGQSRKYSRHQPGFTWKEDVTEANVSLRDTECGQKLHGDCIQDFDLDFKRQMFSNMNDRLRAKVDDSDEVGTIELFLKLQPDYFLKSLGEMGKDKLVDIYERWSSSVGDEDMEKMSERIAFVLNKVDDDGIDS